MKKRNSTSYVCTLDTNSCVDMERLETIKSTISAINNNRTQKKRVVLRGRKPVFKSMVTDRWTGKSGYRSYDAGGNIVGGIRNATVLDVYIYDRRD